MSMSNTSYEMCHVSYRGYLTKEIDAACEVLRKHGKVCADAVKELRRETDMPMRECAEMLRCLHRDMELDRLQSENAKLRADSTHWELAHCPGCRNVADLQEALDKNARLQSQADEWRRVAESKQDIIDHMRDAHAENAKLRDLARIGELTASHCADISRRYEELQVENAKLRRVSGEMYDYLHGILYEHYTIVPERMCDFEERLRELGVIME